MAAYTADELLDFAIDREQEAHDFYMDLAGRAERPDMKDLLTQLAREELRHKKKLEELQDELDEILITLEEGADASEAASIIAALLDRLHGGAGTVPGDWRIEKDIVHKDLREVLFLFGGGVGR